MMKGGQAALEIGFFAAFVAIVIGTLWGAVSGLAGGIVDSAMMRVVDVFLSVPFLFVVLILAVKFGATVLSLSLVIGSFAWQVPARLVRGEVLTLRERDFVLAARTAGSGRWRLISRHLIPNSLGVVIVNVTFQVADAILAVSYIGFLGFGLHFPNVDWGDQLSYGQQLPGRRLLVADLPGRGLHRPDRDGAQLHRRRPSRRDGRAAETPVAGSPPGRCDDQPQPSSTRGSGLMAPVLEIENLSTHIKLTKSVVQAVGNVDMRVDAGETLGIVGESGCGKSMTGLSIMGLLPPGGSIVGGSIKLDGRELVGLKGEELRQVRGNEIAMIFQDPLTSLDPTKTIGYQVAEPVRLHKQRLQGRGPGPGGGGAEPGRPAPAQGAPGRLSAPAVRRPAAARDDRDGAGQRAQAAHRRRAHDGPRRHHPGADPRPAQGPEGPARHGDAADHARHGRDRRARRPGQRHVRGPGRGDGRGDAALHRDAPPLHPGAARLHPPARPGREKGAARHSRPPARPVEPAAGLPVRRQVLSGHGQVPDRRAVAVRKDVRAQVLLLAPGRRAARPRPDRPGRA